MRGHSVLCIGMEMLSYAPGVHHAIVLLIIGQFTMYLSTSLSLFLTVCAADCKLWVWYYDRPGVIQSNGIDFIQDLSSFPRTPFCLPTLSIVRLGRYSRVKSECCLSSQSKPPQRETGLRGGRRTIPSH